MEYNSNSHVFIIILLVCDFTVVRTCTTPGYYACTSTWGCCPFGYDCTATECTKLYYYYASESISSSVGPIVGYCIGGLFGLFVLVAFLSACCKKCKQSCAHTGQVQSIRVQTREQYRKTHTRIGQRLIGSKHVHMPPLTLPGSYDLAYPHTSNHV